MEEYTTTTFFTILTNKTLPNIPSKGGFTPWTPLIDRVLNPGGSDHGPPRQLRSNYLPEQKGEVVVRLMNAKQKSTRSVYDRKQISEKTETRLFSFFFIIFFLFFANHPSSLSRVSHLTIFFHFEVYMIEIGYLRRGKLVYFLHQWSKKFFFRWSTINLLVWDSILTSFEKWPRVKIQWQLCHRKATPPP